MHLFPPSLNIFLVNDLSQSLFSLHKVFGMPYTAIGSRADSGNLPCYTHSLPVLHSLTTSVHPYIPPPLLWFREGRMLARYRPEFLYLDTLNATNITRCQHGHRDGRVSFYLTSLLPNLKPTTWKHSTMPDSIVDGGRNSELELSRQSPLSFSS